MKNHWIFARLFWGLFVVTLFLASSGTAAEIAWLQLHTQMRYVDSSLVCESLRPGGAFLLAAEIESDKVRRAVLSNYPYEWPFQYIYRATPLSEGELSRLKIFRDAKGRAWLKRLEVDEPVLRWILFQPAESTRDCGPPRPVHAATPAPVAFEFDTDDIDLGLLLSYSQRVPFDGLRSDGVRFEAKMRLMQQRYKRLGGIQ